MDSFTKMNLRHFVLLMVIQLSVGVIVKNDFKNDKLKAKKSIETLYTIEDNLHQKTDYNKEEIEASRYPTGGYPGPSYMHQKDNEENRIDPNQLLIQQNLLHSLLASNPLLAALFLSQNLGIPVTSAHTGFNHAQHLPVNPYVALLLSHYGRYITPLTGRHQRGIYGYTAANNYHNNMPFGSYKINEDTRK